MKKQIKKSLSLMLAVLMVLSCWVFVAPTEAEAANYTGYQLTVNFTVSDACNGGTVFCDVTFDDGTTSRWNLDKCESDEGTYDISSSTFSKWPKKLYFGVEQGGMRTQNVKVNNIRINGKTILAGGWTMNPGHWGEMYKTFESNGSVSSGGDTGSPSTNWWPRPTAYEVETKLSAQTITVPNGGGNASKTFTVALADQYDVKWNHNSASGWSLSPLPAGVSTSHGNNSLTITANQTVFDNLSNYNSSTGKATATLTLTTGSITTSCTVTFQSSDYIVAFNDACGTVHNKTCKYNGSVTAPTPCKKSPSETEHYKFSGWNDTTYTGIKANKSVTANYTGTAHVFEGDWVYNNDGTHSRKCTSVDADATCTVIGLNGKSKANGGYAECTGTWGGNDTTHSRTCTTCGGTYTHSPAWQNNPDSYYQVSEQSCETDGVFKVSCSICGQPHSTNTFIHGEKTGHNYTIPLGHTGHTCTEDGYDLWLCENCGVSELKVYDADGDGKVDDPAEHTWEQSLTNKGDGTHGRKCSVCGTEWTEVAEHTWTLADSDIITNPTCTTPGSGTYRCACGLSEVRDIPVDTDAHKYIKTYVDLGDGTHGYRCEYNADHTTAVADHTYVAFEDDDHPVVASTCTTEGSHYEKCSVATCGNIRKVTDPINPDAHNFGEIKDLGNGTHGKVCSYNSAHKSEVNDHTYEAFEDTTHPVVLPTCSATGSHYEKCTVCGNIKQVIDAINPDAHNYGEIIDLGDGTHGKVCSYDNSHKIEVKAHTYEAFEDADHPVVEPTCVATGSHYEKCTVCGNIKQVIDDIDPDNHDMAGATSNNDGTHTATCKRSGCTAGSVTQNCKDSDDDKNCVCDVCSYNIPHIYDKEVVADEYLVSAADCNSYAVYYKSCQCGAVDPDENTFEDVDGGFGAHVGWKESEKYPASEAACEKNAVYYYECTECGISSEDVDGSTWEKDGTALEHNFTANADKSNIVNNLNGTHSYKCQNGCGKVGGKVDCAYGNYYYKDGETVNHYRECADCGYVETTKHTMTKWAPVAEGGKHTRYCPDCNYTETADCEYVITADVASTCSVKGYTSYECKVCGHSYTDVKELDGANHSGNNHFENAIIPVCNAKGYEGDIICECGVKVGEGAILDEDPNNHGDNPVIETGYIEATCVIEGHEADKVCSGCDVVLEVGENIGLNKDNHKNLGDFTGKVPTCEEDGYADYGYCKDCTTVIDGKVLPAIGHDYSGDVVVNNDGTHAYECKNGCGTTGVGRVKGKTEACYGGTATCQKKAECEVCGAEYGELNAHEFTGEIRQFVEDGVEYHNRKCANCDAYGLNGEADAKEACSGGKATCLDKAICKVCNKEYGSALGHDFTASENRIHSFIEEVDGTEVHYHNYKCYRCDVYGIGTEIGGKAACVDAEPEVFEPSCTADGYEIHTCDVCYASWQVEGEEALGHDFTQKIKDSAHLKEAATCVDKAVYWYDCSRCTANAKNEENAADNADLYYEDVVGGHKFDGKEEYLFPATEATCTEDETYYVYCSVCKVTSEDTDDEATFVKPDTKKPHTWVGIVTDEVDGEIVEIVYDEYLKSEATCDDKAVYYEHCSVCNTKGTETFEFGEALGHDYSVEVTDIAHRKNIANCEAPATFYYDCSRCDSNAKIDAPDEEDVTFTKGSKNPANHTSLKYVPALAATCASEGYSAHKVCEGCNTEIDKITYPALAHNFAGEYKCENDHHSQKCLNCDVYGVDGVVGATVPCQFADEWVSNNDGTHGKQCVCGNSKKADCADADPVRTEAACEQDAYTTYTCDDCGYVWVVTEEGTAKEHSYSDTWTSNGDGTHSKACVNGCGTGKTEACRGGTATCEELAVCEVCKAAYGSKADHKYGEYVDDPARPATCTTDKWQIATCTVCTTATIDKQVEGSALGHDMLPYTTDAEGGSEPTCKDEGVEVSVCGNGCGHSVTRIIPADKSKHIWGEWTSDENSGDCVTGIRRYRICTVCADVEEKTEVGEHTWKLWKVVEPTCLEDGSKEYICEVCHFNKFEDSEELKAPGSHAWGETIITKPATCGVTGRGYQVCERCSEKSETIVIDKLSHGPIYDADGVLQNPTEVLIVEAVEPRCERAGHTAYWKCLNCSYESPYEVIPATDHADNDGDGKCDDCKNLIYGDGDETCGCMCHNDTWLGRLFYSIARFFWKLFNMKPTCNCGASHY